MMDNTAAAKESCVGCLFVWRKIHSAVDQSAGPDTISKVFFRLKSLICPITQLLI